MRDPAGRSPCNSRPRARGRLARLAAPLAAATLAGCAGLPPVSMPGAPRAISLDGRCEQRDINDFRERARLAIDNGAVRALSWQLWVGARGTCRFELAEFRQTQALPHVELLARDGSGCKLMVWQDEARITMGHASCDSRCPPAIAEDAWPVMFDPRTGACAPAQ